VPAGTPAPDIRGVATHRAVVPIGDPVEVGGLPCVPPDRCPRVRMTDAILEGE
jgi:hypothetical protein